MDDKNDTEPPEREITVNQIAAWNIARLRRSAGLTQDQLGALIGLSGASVSELERSWDGKRPREFDAQALTAIAFALGVPVVALLLPPDDDGADARYVITAGGARCDMTAYMTLAVMPDREGDTPVMDAYRDRYNAAAARYLKPDWVTRLAAWLSRSQSPAVRASLAARLREREASMLEHAAELRHIAGVITAGEDGQ